MSEPDPPSPSAVGHGVPTPPIAMAGGPTEAVGRLSSAVVPVPDDLIDRLRDACQEVSTDAADRAEASRDWWPLGMHWALAGRVPAMAAAVCRPGTTAEVSSVLAACSTSGVPVTAAGGRSGVCGASVPVHGGVLLDMTATAGVVDVDTTAMVADVLPGTFGDALEDELRDVHGVTVGHWPQSVQLSTVGGWLACRGAGQLSNRYGKIEDIVLGLDVVLADGRLVTVGGFPRAAVGPDLTQLFVGSEGTLGVIVGARLRLHRAPGEPARLALGFESFAAANDACRRVLQRGASPAVLRVYDAAEADRSFSTGGAHVLLVRDEGDDRLVEATLAVVVEEAAGATELDPALVDRWWGHRNDVAALEALTARGYVVDTMEVTVRWPDLGRIYAEVCAALTGVDGIAVATAHQSHAYETGACLYFTFAGRPPDGEDGEDGEDGDDDGEGGKGRPGFEAKERLYVAAWDAGTRAALEAGASLSHHHGIGLNRSRFVRDALGPAFDVLVAAKHALDPHGILNPGKLGLPDPFGEVNWP
jgi:alkyldihydroxyacetonephosphate synthase